MLNVTTGPIILLDMQACKVSAISSVSKWVVLMEPHLTHSEERDFCEPRRFKGVVYHPSFIESVHEIDCLTIWYLLMMFPNQETGINHTTPLSIQGLVCLTTCLGYCACAIIISTCIDP